MVRTQFNITIWFYYYKDNIQFDFPILYVIPVNCEKKILSTSAYNIDGL